MKKSLMKSVHFLILGIILTLGTTFTGNAQPYYIAGGLRAGKPGGITAKMMLTDHTAAEAIIGMPFEESIEMIGLYEIHRYLTNDLMWFWGGGANISVGQINDLGLDGIIGLEVNFNTFPLHFSFDWKPTYGFFQKRFYADRFALSVRFIIRR